MPLLTNPSRPKPPRFNKKRQIPRQDSQTTLREEEERYDDQDQMEYDYAPPLPPKIDMSYAQKSLPITPMDSPLEIYHPGGGVPYQMHRAPTPPRSPKPSAPNRWKAAMGKILTLRRPTHNTKARKRLTPPPLSPASSRQPSFYVPNRRDFKPHRSAVTLLTSGSSTQHSQEDYDDDLVTNIGLSRSSLVQGSPVTPVTRAGYHHDHYEPITSVLQRAGDTITVPSPITPYTPYSPARRSPTRPTVRRDTTSRAAPRSATPQRANHNNQRSQRSTPTPIPPSSTPPPVWPAPGSPPLIIANPTPSPTPSPSPPPVQVKRSTTRASQPPRPKLRTTASAGVMLPPLTTAQKRVGPRIIQAQLPSPVSPDPKKHVFIGPWLNRRGDEWLGISSVPGEYRVKAAKEENAFDPKYISYPEQMHHFMNPMGDVMDAKTLGMVSKAVRM